jgi:DNA repair ATPase RecN
MMSNQVARSRVADAAAVFDAEPNDSMSHGDSLDDAGQTIVSMIDQAAGMAEDNIRRALDAVQRISQQLQAAEDRIKELEGRARYYQGRAERAEDWLRQISTEIEQRFFRKEEDRRASGSASANAASPSHH